MLRLVRLFAYLLLNITDIFKLLGALARFPARFRFG